MVGSRGWWGSGGQWVEGSGGTRGQWVGDGGSPRWVVRGIWVVGIVGIQGV